MPIRFFFGLKSVADQDPVLYNIMLFLFFLYNIC